MSKLESGVLGSTCKIMIFFQLNKLCMLAMFNKLFQLNYRFWSILCTVFLCWNFILIFILRWYRNNKARLILPANANAMQIFMWIWRHNSSFAAIFARELSSTELSANFVVNLWRQHSYYKRIRRKYGPGLIHFEIWGTQY